MKFIVCGAAILSVFCSFVTAPDPVTQLGEWRRLNHEKFDEFSQIRHKKISAQTTNQAHIEYLTKVDIIMAVDREIFASFNFRLTGLLQNMFDEIWNNPDYKKNILKASPQSKREKTPEKKDDKTAKKDDKKKASPPPVLDPIVYSENDLENIDGVKVMEKLGDYFAAINALRDFIDDKEFQHLLNMNDLEAFHTVLNKSVEEGTNFTPEQLKPVELILESEYPKIRKCRQKIVKKASELRDVCTNDDDDEGPLLFYLSLEANTLLGRIASAVKRYFEPNNRHLQQQLFADFKPKVDELDEEFTKNAIVKEFIAANDKGKESVKNRINYGPNNIITMFEELEASEKKVCDALNSLVPKELRESSPKKSPTASPELKKAKMAKK